MTEIKATENKAATTETKKFLDTSTKESTETIVKKKITELIQKLHVNQGKANGLVEQLNMIKKEGLELVGAIKQLQELLGDLEQ